MVLLRLQWAVTQKREKVYLYTYLNYHSSMFLAGSSGPSFSTKAPSSSAKPQAQPWQSGRPSSAQNKPWMPGSGPGSAPKASAASQPAGTQPTKPNYNLNFSSVIGGREERGVRGPGFGKRHWVDGKLFVTRIWDNFYVWFSTIITQILRKYRYPQLIEMKTCD